MGKTTKIIFTLVFTTLVLCGCNSSIPKTFTVTWKDYDGTVLEIDKNVLEGTIPSYDSEEPTRENEDGVIYSFNGWDKEIIPVKEDIVYIATYDEEYIYHTVNFDTDGGTEIEPQKIKHGEHISKPDDPIKEGYHVLEWTYKDETWSFAAFTVKEDMVLKIKWEPNQYKITKENGSEVEESLVSYNSDYNLGVPNKDGYRFKGWYSEKYCQGIKYTDEKGNSLKPYDEIGNKTLYAGFTYSVSFVSNGGKELSPITLIENECLNQEKIIISRDDSVFIGWFTDIGLTNPVSYSEPLLGNTILYAKWSEETSTSYFQYKTINENEIEITGTSINENTICVPSYINNMKVTSIGKGAFNNKDLLSTFIFPKYINNIEEEAFFNCSNIRNITIPNTVNRIGKSAFRGCTSIQMMTLPFIGESESANTYLGYLFGANSHIESSNFIPASLKRVNLSNGCVLINDNAFYNCFSINSISIPESVTSIGNNAFSNCKALSKIDISSNVKEIGNEAFLNCPSYRFIYFT